ncbi:MAG: class I SAM-dependent methyltransferase [Alistipes sp.]|nr:class I SAM-dependent methyltransferase [Alistipes sp.]
MANMHTAERVSPRDESDNFVFQRSLLAYHYAAQLVSGDVLEVGTGMGYGIEIIAPAAKRFVTIDKNTPALGALPANSRFWQMAVPPIAMPEEAFDCVVSFQVIEHIKRDREFVSEVHRVLRHGGRFIVSTPNAPRSLTRNPWHVREYRAEELKALLGEVFDSVECLGVAGNEKVMAYYEQNRQSVERIMRYDVLDLQHRLPRWVLQLPYDVMNRLNRRRLLDENNELTRSITMDDYRICPASDECFDLYFVATKK